MALNRTYLKKQNVRTSYRPFDPMRGRGSNLERDILHFKNRKRRRKLTP